MLQIQMSNQDRNTILAALRFYQGAGQGDPGCRTDEIHDIACGLADDSLEESISLDDEGIDDLCERLNCAPKGEGK